ncbi:hypothetical protein HY772_04240 [Candidatus Woesearchaeota archaeon]|nr:hypothetical protein [Candidatus Woesearchaeota archaeon]
MSLIVTLTGSYPPHPDIDPPRSLTIEEAEPSIRFAVEQQQQAVSGRPVNWLYVSGQPQDDIVSIYAKGLDGLKGEHLPFKVVSEIKHTTPIALRELEIAHQAIDGKPLKAHITGAMLMAEHNSIELTENSPVLYRNDDPDLRRHLIIDIANALAEETRLLTNNSSLNIQYVQIDEPPLTAGADSTLAKEAIEIIAKASKVPVILHVCGDISPIMNQLLDIQVDILNVEGQHLTRVRDLTPQLLRDHGKKLAIGCLPVNANEIPTERQLERDLLRMADRYGAENIWGITPNCGMRWSDRDVARLRLDRLANVALKVASRFEQA